MVINLKKDLTDVKVTDRKKKILKIISKWLIQNNGKDGEKFKEEFLSEDNDKYFDEIKESIGDFKELKNMSVLYFLGNVIIGMSLDIKIINELHEDFKKLRLDFRNNN